LPARSRIPVQVWLGYLVALAARRPLVVLVLAVAVTLSAAYATATRISIRTDTKDMLSEDLAFRRNDAAVRAAFPQLTDVLSIVVEAGTPDAAGEAAVSLARDLAGRPEAFRTVFYPVDEPFFRRNGLLYLDLPALQNLADRLARAQPLLASLSQDMSLRGLAEVMDQALTTDLAPAEQRFLTPILEHMAEAAADVAAARAEGRTARPIAWAQILDGSVPAPEDLRRFIVVQPVLDYGSMEPAAPAIEVVRARVAALGLDAREGVRVRLTGSPVMLQDELHSVQSGLGLAGLMSFALVSLILALGMRRARLIFPVLATLVMGLIWTAGFAALSVGELNLISVAFAVLFIGLSVDFGIHFALRYQEAAWDSGGSPAAASLRAAALAVGGPLALAALAAAIGFFAFFPTSYRGLSELGLISGAGMFIALVANLTVLPALLSLWPLAPGRQAEPRASAGLGARLQNGILIRPRAVLGLVAVLALGAAATLPQVRFDDDPFNLRDPDSESMATLIDLMGDSRVQPYSADLLAPDLAQAEALAAELEQLPEVAAAVTLADYVPAEQDAKLGVIEDMSFFLGPVFQEPAVGAPLNFAARQAALASLRASLAGAPGELAAPAGRLAATLDSVPPDAEGLAALEAAWLGGLRARLDDLALALEAGPVAIEDLPDALRARMLAPDGRARVEIQPAEDLRDAEARRRFVDAIEAVAPNVSGAPVTITEAGRAVVRAFLEAAVLALAAIGVLLLLVLRSWRDSALVLAPLLLAALLTLAATVVLGVPFNFANVIALPLLFGLGVAGGIHVVSRARAEGAERLSGTSTPRAVLLSALTTIASFGALALSAHRGTASMGILLTVAIGLSLLTTLVVLPALLGLRARAGRSAGDSAGPDAKGR
jgi:hopanoid biosynthesis associated RND transporter like protein HpnN